jgi:hypothetical protein
MMILDCPSMEDEQNCGGSTPSYCRADQFRCGATCVPNVSLIRREYLGISIYFLGLAV